MDTQDLDKQLTKALTAFSSEMRNQYDDYSKDPVCGGDLAELSRQTFYVLDEFRKSIIS